MYARDLPLRLRGRELSYLWPEAAILKVIIAKGLPMGIQMVVISMSALALKTIKRVLNTTYDTSLAVGLEVEGHAYEKLRDSEDYKEGIAAFSAKRKPQFKS